MSWESPQLKKNSTGESALKKVAMLKKKMHSLDYLVPRETVWQKWQGRAQASSAKWRCGSQYCLASGKALCISGIYSSWVP